MVSLAIGYTSLFSPHAERVSPPYHPPPSTAPRHLRFAAASWTGALFSSRSASHSSPIRLYRLLVSVLRDADHGVLFVYKLHHPCRNPGVFLGRNVHVIGRIDTEQCRCCGRGCRVVLGQDLVGGDRVRHGITRHGVLFLRYGTGWGGCGCERCHGEKRKEEMRFCCLIALLLFCSCRPRMLGHHQWKLGGAIVILSPSHNLTTSKKWASETNQLRCEQSGGCKRAHTHARTAG